MSTLDHQTFRDIVNLLIPIVLTLPAANHQQQRRSMVAAALQPQTTIPDSYSESDELFQNAGEKRTGTLRS